jgi:hypothetical protein
LNSTKRTPNSPFHTLLLPAVLFRLPLPTGASDQVQTGLLLLLTAVRIVTVTSHILETPGPPAFARDMSSTYIGS